MSRVFNFSAGPSALPLEVLERARAEMLEYQGTGMSVMEMSHRSKPYVRIAEGAELLLRELMGISEAYKVLFLQGGATAQFAAIPMNLLRGRNRVAHVNTGIWSKKAISEAKHHATVDIAASSEEGGFVTVPDPATWTIAKDAAYVHYTANETIGGLEFQSVPEIAAEIPLVCDMSSNILSRAIDVDRFGLIYAGAQKNMGPSGICVVIVREDLIGSAVKGTPSVLDYRQQADNGSMLNTPPTYAWYLLGLVLEWLKEKGGVEAIERINQQKADKLYRVIDGSDFYANPIDPAARSRMNIPFRIHDVTLDATFLEEAKSQGLVNLEGHRSVGGFRASIYNAMPEAGVDALVEFMQGFEQRYG